MRPAAIWPQPRGDRTSEISITLPARAENVAVVRHALRGLEDVLEIDPRRLADIELAVTEACTNVVVHAYREGEGTMEVSTVINDGHDVVVAVRDSGPGITPRPDSPGLGIGLPLIASLADSVALSRDATEHTEVRMTFGIARNGS